MQQASSWPWQYDPEVPGQESRPGDDGSDVEDDDDDDDDDDEEAAATRKETETPVPEALHRTPLTPNHKPQ